MAVLVVTADLGIVSLAGGAASRQAIELQTAMTSAAASEALAANAFSLVIFDLGMPRLDIAPTIQQLRGSPSATAQVIAFGPHVQEALLSAARTAGCDRVLTRGQLHAQIDAILVSAKPGQ